MLTSSCVWRASFGIGMECATRCVRSQCAECRVVFSSSLVLWRGFVRCWPCPVFVFLLFSWSGLGYSIFYPSAVCCWWAPAPGAAALAGLLRLALVYGRFGVFASSWFWGFLRFWPRLFACRSLLVFLPRSGGIDLILCLVGQTLAWSAECATRCVRFLCAECRGVFSSSLVLWRGFVRWWPCPALQ